MPQSPVMFVHATALAFQLPGFLPRPALPHDPCRLMSVNSLTGTLPGAWASNGGFQQLSVLQLDSNFLEGGLPAPLRGVWGCNAVSYQPVWGLPAWGLGAGAPFAGACMNRGGRQHSGPWCSRLVALPSMSRALLPRGLPQLGPRTAFLPSSRFHPICLVREHILSEPHRIVSTCCPLLASLALFLGLSVLSAACTPCSACPSAAQSLSPA